ncbi:MAG: hypothetical protein K6G84_04180 [Lachnospiraceae bacterium]|nr:hypothetical protein [Lachnospiraceae bacterium]
MRNLRFTRCVAALSSAAIISTNIVGALPVTNVYAAESSVPSEISEKIDLAKAEDHTWDFGSDSLTGHIEGSSYEYDNIFIDATATGAKAAPNGAQWTQVNADTKFYIPVKGDAVITLKAYNKDADQFKINGDKFEVSGSYNPFTYVYNYKGDAKIIELDVVKNTYFESLEVKHEGASQTENTKEEVEPVAEPEEKADYSDKFEYPVEYNEWDFANYDEIKNDAERIEGKDGYFHELYVDASKGKFNPRENGGKDDAQVNAGTKIVVPLNKSTVGKATINVSYTQGSITINGEEYSSGNDFICEYHGYSYAVIECTANTYIYKISASYPKSVFDTKDSGAVDVWDFGGISSNIAGAVDHIKEDEYEKATDLVASYDKTKTDKATGKTYVVKTVSEAFAANGKLEIGDLTLSYATGDRIYTASGSGNTQQATKKKGQFKFADGYTSNGYYYANGNGGSGRRYIEISNVKAGNIIDVYMDSKNAEETAHFVNVSTGEDEIFTVSTEPSKYEFIAAHDGTYKIYTDTTNNGKIDVFKVVRRTDTVVQGKIDFGNCEVPENYNIVLTDEKTGEEVEAEVDADSNKYGAYIKAGHVYKASIRNAAGYAVEEETSKIEVETKDITERSYHDLEIKAVDTVKVHGKVTGFNDGFTVSAVSIVFTDKDNSSIVARLDENGSYEAAVNAGSENTVSLENCYDYVLKEVKTLVADADIEQDYEVENISTYSVFGKLLNIPDGVSVNEITFTNVADKQSYKGTVEELKYKAELRNGTYSAVIDNDSYKTKTTVVVNDKYAEKDLYFNAEKSYANVGSEKDIYVGYADKDLNFETVQAAVDAIEATRTNKEDRVTIHIAPGTYREQVVINTPNLTLKADEGNVKLTWYYGIGYVYYSAKEGYYDSEAAYNKLKKGNVDKWGASVYVKSNARGFKADGITFENSFNRYVTEEELADGVEASVAAYPDTKITFKRTEGADVRTTAATERATALAVDATNVEFTNCTLLGSQDTLYTHKGTTGYFNNCTITGNTDFIFGYGDYVFEGCVLKYEGYSDVNKKHSYITANRGEAARFGYLFNNCTVVGPSKGFSLSGNYLGRPWGEDAKVAFKNTSIVADGLVLDQGWTNMGDRLPINVSYKEYDTEEAGKPVDQKKRIFKRKDKVTKAITASGNSSTVYTTEAALGICADDYFASDWKPDSFVTDTIEFEIKKGTAKDYKSYTVYFTDEQGNEIMMPVTRLVKADKKIEPSEVAVSIKGYVFSSGRSEVDEIFCTYKKADTSYTVKQVVRRTGKVLGETKYDGIYGSVVEINSDSLESIRGYKVYNRGKVSLKLRGEASNVIMFYYDEGEEEPKPSTEEKDNPSTDTPISEQSDPKKEETSKEEETPKKEETPKESSENDDKKVIPEANKESSEDVPSEEANKESSEEEASKEDKKESSDDTTDKEDKKESSEEASSEDEKKNPSENKPSQDERKESSDNTPSNNNAEKEPSRAVDVPATVSYNLGNGIAVTAPVSVEYNGKKYKKNSDLGISVTYNGQVYTGNDVKLKVKGHKDVGTITIQLKAIKGIKASKKDFKNTNTFTVDVAAFNVTADKVAQKKVKNGIVKAIKVNMNGKVKSISKKMFTQNGNTITFSGNFSGNINLD